MIIVPIFQKEANLFVAKHHRHHKPVVGSIFQIGLMNGGELVGVAICGRPVGRKVDYKTTIEVNRMCIIEGVKNGCSKLYSSCARIAKEMGYSSIITYTLESEPGVSLIASGWVNEGVTGGLSWNSSGSRVRENIVTNIFGEEQKYPFEKKIRWRKQLSKI